MLAFARIAKAYIYLINEENMNELLSMIKDNKKKLESLDGKQFLYEFSNITLNLLEPFIINSYLKRV